MSRPGWFEYFLGIAEAVAKRGDCTRSQVGAVIWDMQTNVLIATGYNGVEPGKPGCLDGACPRGALSYDQCPPGGGYSNCIAMHAEENAIRWMNRNNRTLRTESMAITVTREPCVDCMNLIKSRDFLAATWPGGYWLRP